jgi:hypothetical protein
LMAAGNKHAIDGQVQKCLKCHFVTETKSELLKVFVK